MMWFFQLKSGKFFLISLITHLVLLWICCIRNINHVIHMRLPQKNSGLRMSVVKKAYQSKNVAQKVSPVPKKEECSSLPKQTSIKKSNPIATHKNMIKQEKKAASPVVKKVAPKNNQKVVKSSSNISTIKKQATKAQEIQKALVETSTVVQPIAPMQDQLSLKGNPLVMHDPLVTEESSNNDDALHIPIKSDAFVVPTEVETIEGVLTIVCMEQWRPPKGVAVGTSATVSFKINEVGKIVDILLIKPSSVLAFDISIKSLLMRIKVPHKYIHSTCTITFTI